MRLVQLYLPCPPPFLTLTGSVVASSSMKNALYVMGGIAVLTLIVSISVWSSHPFSKSPRKKKKISSFLAGAVYLSAILTLTISLLCFHVYRMSVLPLPPDTDSPVTEVFSPSETTLPETFPTEDHRASFEPFRTVKGHPKNWGVQWEIIKGDQIVDRFTRDVPISLGEGEDYFALPGVATFRGNNYRNSPSYGSAEVREKVLKTVWSHPIGALNKWGGCAWTGQPLVVQWDPQTRSIMNLYSSKKEKEYLTEVIYATLDGMIHFYDLEDGAPTRDPIKIGLNFKGAGALDPRGYPLLYVGSGLYVGKKAPRMHVISLIDGSVLYEYGNRDSFTPRDWTAFDASPLVDAESDTLIWPGESGLLYTIRLNTSYNPEAGTISVTPDPPVRTRYANCYTEQDRYCGYEDSPCVIDHYLYASDNGGMFYCVDLNTMELIWAQDTKDDSNSSPVFEWSEDGKTGYLYTAPSLHWTAEDGAGSVSIYKLDARTGDILWEVTRECVTIAHVSGGVQASPLLGKPGTDIEDLIIYVVARVPTAYNGTMIALNRKTGDVVWEVSTRNYAWSSPVPFYTKDGKAYIALCNASGKLRLFDGATGEILDAIGFDQTTEASPVVFNNMMVLGTREGVYGIKIS